MIRKYFSVLKWNETKSQSKYGTIKMFQHFAYKVDASAKTFLCLNESEIGLIYPLS